ncbi:glutamine amidotransferase [Heliobacterium undosum]|uniref:Glutamine amidotransferase n=2 Tax=Heliomicrobium undosum TaxID=121734 RepID=A0A845L3J4_9FIRM|nr:glutamine amidotransferase [Heliomicrobium undosum]
MKKLLIIKTGATLASILASEGDFEDFILRPMGLSREQAIITPVFEGAGLPGPSEIKAVVITGSHAMVTDNDEWSLNLSSWLRDVRPTGIPILGICYGHQLLARAFGGDVDYHPKGKEVGTATIELTEAGKKDPLLGCLPERFWGHVTHAQTALRLPEGATLLAQNVFEPHHAFVLDGHIWGVQFHPEFNAAITGAYIDAQNDQLLAEGQDPEGLRRSIVEHSYGKMLLRRFYELVGA